MQGLFQGKLSCCQVCAEADEKDLRRSGRTVDEEWPSFAEHVRVNGSHFSPLLDLPSRPPSPSFSQTSPNPNNNNSTFTTPDFGMHRTPSQRRDTESHGPNRGGATTPAGEPRQSWIGGAGSRLSMARKGRKSLAPTIIARDRAIEKQGLVDSAERLYLRYLLPGAEREIYLP